MLLTRSASSQSVQMTVTHETSIEPGDRLDVEVVITATLDATVESLDWIATLPGMRLDASQPLALPAELSAGGRVTLNVSFDTRPTDETFGFLEAELTVEAPGMTPEASRVGSRSWLSIFRREKATDSSGLSPEHRLRLTGVVNHDDAVGHWMLADPWAFFDHFLNLDVPSALQASVGDALGLGDQGLPLDEETRYEIWVDNKSFYGMVRLRLTPEEECVESDEHIDFSPAREVDYEPDITI